MRIRFTMIGMLLCIHPFYANAVTLEQAMQDALEHPMLKVSGMQVDSAAGELKEQRSYAYNPELTLEPQRRNLNGGGSSNDYYVTLSQGIELGGKRGYRERSAEAALEAVKQESELKRQKVQVNAARALVALYFSKRELLWRNQQAVTLLKLNQAITRQMELGEASQLDVNLDRASLTQAIQAEAEAKNAHAMNVSAYVLATGVPENAVQIEAELPRLLVGWKPLSDPVEIALNSRPEIATKRQRLAQYAAQADLARANKIPDVNIGLTAAREAGDQLYSVGITVPIPVLNSHDGAYRSALSREMAQQTELDWLEQQIKLEVQEAAFNHATAMRALLAINQIQSNSSSKDSIELAKAAFDAGELDIEGLVVHINQILDSRINAAAILKQGWLARIHFAEALGHPEYILEGTQQ